MGRSVTWWDVAFAAAFVLGVIVGGLAVIQVVRYVLGYVRRESERDD